MTKKVNIFSGSPKPRSMPLSELEVEQMVFNLLLELGISPNLKGFRYLSDGVIEVYRNHELGEKIVGELYSYIAKKHGTNSQCVERAVRHALNRKQHHNGDRIAKKYFGARELPTPKKFINAVADELRSLDSANEE